MRLWIVALLLCAACNLAPRYTPPYIDFPAQWRENLPPSCECAVRWWEEFDDPVLSRLIKEALSYNLDLYIATERLCEYFAKYRIATADRLPLINAKANATKQEISNAAFPVQGIPLVENSFWLYAAASWELDLFGKLQNRSTAAWLKWLAQSHERRGVILTLIASVAFEYLKLRELDRELEIAKLIAQSRSRSLQLARLRYEGGLTSEIEVYQAESESSVAESSVVGYRLLIAQKEDLISLLVGSPARAVERGKNIQELAVDQPIATCLPAQIVSQRPDIQKAEAELIAMGARVGVARANLYPSLGLNFTAGKQSQEIKDLFTQPATAWNMAANLMQLLYDGGKSSAEVQVADSQRMQACYNFQKTVLNALREVEDALAAHRAAGDMVDVQTKRTAALRNYLELTTLQYEMGQTDYLSVLNAERNLFSAQLDLTSAQADTLFSRVSLYRALGGDWVDFAEEELDCD